MAKRTDNVEQTPDQIHQAQLRKENEYIIKNKRVRRQTRRRALVIILLLFLLVVGLMAGVTYAIMQFVDESQFRVSVSHSGSAWLSLSKDYEFTKPTSVLDVSAPQNMDNCTLCNFLDAKLIEMNDTDGAYKGAGAKDFYIATTFYLKNSGKEDISYKEIISLDHKMKGMEKAIRVLVIKDIEPPSDASRGTIVCYAAPKSDADGNTLYDEEGNPYLEEVVPPGGEFSEYRPQGMAAYEGFEFDEEDIREDGVWMTKAFASDGYVLNSEYYPLKQGEIIKYTVLIWLEGQDEQCVDSILGGQVKIEVEFSASAAK